jgi:uncharacterized membrane protein HdeD (DUF308 family)
MTDVVGAGAAVRGEASAPRDPGWAGLLVSLLAIALIPSTPLLQVLLPVTQPILLLVPALAVCALLGWAAGGPFWLALLWVAIAAVTVRVFPAPASALSTISKGWAVLVSGTFGVVSMTSDRQTKFFPRALAAVGFALAIAGVAVLVSGVSEKTLAHSIGNEIAVRPNGFLAWWREEAASPDYRQTLSAITGDSTASTAYIQQFDHDLAVVPVKWAQQLFVAFLALESLTVLALAWALYHRISRTRIGPPLAQLRDFRFNDELVWGLIVGIVFMLVPRVTGGSPAWSTVGFNLFVFFGTLYALRGLGVLAWFIRSARFGVVTLVAIAVVGGVLAITALLAPVLGIIGLGDTFENWRARARPTT